MALIWCNCDPLPPRHYAIPQRRISDRLPVLQPRGMTTFVARRLRRDDNPSRTARLRKRWSGVWHRTPGTRCNPKTPRRA